MVYLAFPGQHRKKLWEDVYGILSVVSFYNIWIMVVWMVQIFCLLFFCLNYNPCRVLLELDSM